MKVHRVSDIVHSLGTYFSLDMLLSMHEGREFHTFMATKYKNKGEQIEKDLCCLMVTKGRKKEIVGLITGRPDRGYMKQGVLYVIEGKTVSEKTKKLLQPGGGDQLALYAYLITIIYPKVKKIVLEIGVYIRRENPENRCKKEKEHGTTYTYQFGHTLYKETLTKTSLQHKLTLGLQKKGILAPKVSLLAPGNIIINLKKT